jgi:hypothetical protein
LPDTVHSGPVEGLPRPLRRRAPPPIVRAIGRFTALYVLRPITWLLRLAGFWPRGIARGFNRVLANCEQFVPTEHDVLVCSFFKSGTNWMMQIALQIAWRGNAQFKHIHDLVPWVDIPARSRFAVPLEDSLWQQCPTQLRVIKTHLPFGKIEYTESGKYIWVVRDPKDVFVSGYHFLRNIMFGPLMPSVEQWLDVFLSEDSFNGSWAAHLDCGWRARDRENVLFLTYEEMKRDRAGSIAAVAESMGVELSAAELDRVNEVSSYEHMKTIGEKFDTVGISPPWVDARGKMVRRGRAGSSGELLTPEQQRRIDDYWRAELLGLGSDFPYDEHYG